VAGLRITGTQLAVLVTVPVVVGALMWLLYRTTFGRSVEAAADNPSLARLSSVSPKLISTFVWTAAGLVSTIAMILFSTLNGGVGGLDNLGPITLSRAVIAFVLAGMRSYPRAVVAGMLLGVGEAILRFNFINKPGLFDLVGFVLVLVVIYVQSRSTTDDGVFAFAAKVRKRPERVNEVVMRDHTVIPMSFGTIFKTKDDIVQLLRSAYDAFGDVLSKMRDKMEFGLKVLWDRDSVVRDIEDEDEGIHRLKNEIALQKGSTYFARMQYGRAIDAALQSRSERYGTEILDRLRDVAVASRINKPIGDKMIMNAAFLVSRDQEGAFDSRVKSIAAEHDKLTFKYTGPWPPYNFVNIRLKLERV